MPHTITELGPREAEFLAEMAGSGREVFTIEQAAAFWGSGQHGRSTVARLEKKGWLERLERGKYLIVPLSAGPQREWSEDPLAIGTILVPDGGAAYWSAVRHWGWTAQLPQTQFFITPARRYRSHSVVLGVPYVFVTMKPERVFGFAEEWSGSLRIRVTDRERTVVDMLHRPDLVGGVAEVSESLKEAWPQLDQDRLLGYVARFGSGTVPKRLGFLAEHLALPGAEPLIRSLRASIGAGMTALERGGAPGGRLTRRWNLRINASGFDGVVGG
jgi:predicted transcriptional regulator of viral defense system